MPLAPVGGNVLLLPHADRKAFFSFYVARTGPQASSLWTGAVCHPPTGRQPKPGRGPDSPHKLGPQCQLLGGRSSTPYTRVIHIPIQTPTEYCALACPDAVDQPWGQLFAESRRPLIFIACPVWVGIFFYFFFFLRQICGLLLV